jgi:trk system potassium uptake protein TrkH
VTLFWVGTSALSALPFAWLLELGSAAAFFEAVSGITTTGATVLTGLDVLPPSIGYYRMQLHWIGGIGVIVVAVAVLPMLGVGGMSLLKAEVSGPLKDDKLTPRITKTAQYLSVVYVGLSAACALAYWFAGMSVFDAVTHAMSTLSTGGFSTHDASMAHFDSLAIELIASVFMLAGALPFTVHFIAARSRSGAPYRASGEVRLFAGIVAATVALTTLVLWVEGAKASIGAALRSAVFNVSSIITSTGFTTDNFALWPTLLPVFMMFASCIGGCAGSTAGGIKVIRIAVLARNCLRQILCLVHPNLVRPLKIEGRVLPERVTDAVWGFFTLYVIVFGLVMIVAMIGGMDQVSAFGAVACTINNLGPGLGEVATTFATVDDWLKYVFAASMLLGRLELFTLIVMLHPDFWRR